MTKASSETPRKAPATFNFGSQADFVTVKHGDNEEVMLVTWCKVKVFLQYLREKCLGEIPTSKINKTLDLLDMEGNVRMLSDNLEDYANRIVPPRKTYILVEVQKTDEYQKYTALLENFDKTYPKLRGRLEELSRTSVERDASGRWATLKSLSKLNSLAKKSNQDGPESTRSESRKGSVSTEDKGPSRMNSRRGSVLSDGKKKKK